LRGRAIERLGDRPEVSTGQRGKREQTTPVVATPGVAVLDVVMPSVAMPGVVTPYRLTGFNWVQHNSGLNGVTNFSGADP